MPRRTTDNYTHWRIEGPRTWLGGWLAFPPGSNHIESVHATWQEAMDYVNERLAHDAEPPS